MNARVALAAVLTVLCSWTARSQSERSVWAGVFTEQQAARGQSAFAASCSSCHGAADFTGDSFLGTWEASTALDLLRQLQKTMPMDNPGSLPPENYADVIAYFFRLNAFPPGESELPTAPEQLTRIRIERRK